MSLVFSQALGKRMIEQEELVLLHRIQHNGQIINLLSLVSWLSNWPTMAASRKQKSPYNSRAGLCRRGGRFPHPEPREWAAVGPGGPAATVGQHWELHRPQKHGQGHDTCMAFSMQHSQSQALTVLGLCCPVVSSRPIPEVPEMPVAVCLREQKLCGLQGVRWFAFWGIFVTALLRASKLASFKSAKGWTPEH